MGAPCDHPRERDAVSRRAHISDRTRLASALLALGLVEYEHAKAMGRENFLSLFHFDHGILHGVEVNDEFWNLTPRLIPPHREKSKADTGIVAKVKRMARATSEAQARLLAKATGQDAPEPRRRKVKIKSRGFQKGYRPIRSRGFEKRTT